MKEWFSLVLMLAIAGLSCKKNAYNSKNMDLDSLEKKLVGTYYPDLFLGNNNLVDSIWDNGKNQAKLGQIIESGTSHVYAKFLAAEILRHFDINVPPEHYAVLSEAYAYALEHTSVDDKNYIQLSGNVWGLLYATNDVGTLGKQLLLFGDACTPYLLKLLDSEGRILYIGSQDATIGNAYQYRVKDIAAYYIAKIKNIPITFYEEIEKRDREIEQLRKKLEAE